MRPGRFFFFPLLVDTVCYTRTDPCSSVCFPSSSIVRFLCVCCCCNEIRTWRQHAAAPPRVSSCHTHQTADTHGWEEEWESENRERKIRKKRRRLVHDLWHHSANQPPKKVHQVHTAWLLGLGILCVCVVRGAGLTCQIGRRKLSQHDWKSLTRSRKRETHERKRGNQVDSEARKECHKKLSKYKNDRQVKRTSCWYNLRINSLHYAKRWQLYFERKIITIIIEKKKKPFFCQKKEARHPRVCSTING